MDALMNALQGGYVEPSPGRDPLRSGSTALPSGRNIYGIDPWRLPNEQALKVGKRVANGLLEKYKKSHEGRYPETVSISLWALDTIKTEGESIATILALTGAKPVADAQGKIYKYEPIPLEALGRPRVDVYVDMSAIFRDSFSQLVNLMDKLFSDLSELDEEVAHNYIRQHYLQAIEEGISKEDASSRIFSRPAGRYGNGIDQLIQEASWADEEELETALIQTSAFSYGGGKRGKSCPEIFKKMLSTVDNAFQLIDSAEYGLTDIPFYFSNSGAVKLVAENISSKKVDLTYAETFQGKAQIRDSKEVVAKEVRAKLLNPKWYEQLLENDYAGAAELSNQFTNVLGLAAVEKNVDKWVFDEMADHYIFNDAIRQKLEKTNVNALGTMVGRFLEANNRGLWDADDETIEQLEALYDELEDKMEGVSNGKE